MAQSRWMEVDALMAIAVNGYTPPNGITTNEQVKALQQQLNANGAGLKVDGVYGPLTQAAYMASQGGAVAAPATPAVYPNSSFDSYYNSIKASLSPQTISYTMPDLNALTGQIAAYLRPSYDQAIANRQTQTEQNRADIDADAASRGMGRSSWVTDVKARENKAEATDIANLESNYGAALAEAVLNQYNMHLSNKLQADMANAEMAAKYEQLAYDRAADMYNMMLKSSGGSGSSSSSSKRRSGDDTAIDWAAYIESLEPYQMYELMNSNSSDAVAVRNAMQQDATFGTAAYNNTVSTKKNDIQRQLMEQFPGTAWGWASDSAYKNTYNKAHSGGK